MPAWGDRLRADPVYMAAIDRHGGRKEEIKMSEFRVKCFVVGSVATNCYLAYNEETKRAVVVDPGDRAEEIQAECESLGLKPEAILLTHGHFDHMMAAEELRTLWGVKIYAGEKEEALLADSKVNMMFRYTRKDIGLKADVLLKDNEVFEAAGFTWIYMETPGHTIGSGCYYIEAEGALFSGDTLFQLSYGRVDFPTGDANDMLNSIRRLLTTLPDEVMVYPGHMGQTKIGYEKTHNPLAGYIQ